MNWFVVTHPSDLTSSFTELLSELLFFFCLISFLDLAFSRRLRRNPETGIIWANMKGISGIGRVWGLSLHLWQPTTANAD